MSAQLLNSLERNTTVLTEHGLNKSENTSIKETCSSYPDIALDSNTRNPTKCEDEEKMHKVDFKEYFLANGDEKIISLRNKDNLSSDGARDLCFLTCFRRLFSLRKRNSVEKQLSHRQDHSPVCKEAIETFSALIDEKDLLSLIGKEFTLNTSVSIQSIDQAKGSEPNLIIQGSIPFTVETPEGLKKKKVRVKGRLYNPASDTNQSTGGGDWDLPTDVQQHENKINCISVNTNFRPTLCATEEIKWCTIEKYTQEEYQMSFYGYLFSKSPPVQLKKLDGFVDSTSEQKEDSQDVPVKSITLTRVKVRHLKYSDGSQCKQTCGKQQMTLKMPNGVYLKKKDTLSPEMSEEIPQTSRLEEMISYYDPSRENIRTENNSLTLGCLGSHTDNVLCVETLKKTSRFKKNHLKGTAPYDNAFTQAAYMCLKSYRTNHSKSECMKSSPIISNKELKTSISITQLKTFMQRNLYTYPSLWKTPCSRFWPVT